MILELKVKKSDQRTLKVLRKHGLKSIFKDSTFGDGERGSFVFVEVNDVSDLFLLEAELGYLEARYEGKDDAGNRVIKTIKLTSETKEAATT